MTHGISYHNGKLKIDLDRLQCRHVELVSNGKTVLAYFVNGDGEQKKTYPLQNSESNCPDLSAGLPSNKD